ncbi:MAG TPA: sigma-70 family RNA polymerase sigma factor [Gemmataceae bacterium]|nr:sigma-70 family RNA polymerase sigma factor [Gemmataceae bacterium]
MSDAASFGELIARVRAGDARAAAEVVLRYEPTLRRAVRLRLRRDPRLCRLLDSVDVCQSVLASFFVRAALGQYDLSTPEHLVKLLATIARNKVINQGKKQRAARHDPGPGAAPAEGYDVAAPGPGPAREAEARELLAEALRRLSPEERRLLEMREGGQGWAEIAAALGGRPDALRMQLARGTARVTRELGLDEDGHE